jgi:hypothetical protein
VLALLFGRFAAGRFVPGSSLLDVSRDVLFLEPRSWCFVLVPGSSLLEQSAATRPIVACTGCGRKLRGYVF